MANYTLTQSFSEIQADLNKVEDLVDFKAVGDGLTLSADGTLASEVGAKTYAELPDKPSINGVTLDGNQSASSLGISFSMDKTWEEVDGTYIPILDGSDIGTIFTNMNLGAHVGIHGNDRTAVVVNCYLASAQTHVAILTEDKTVLYHYPKTPEDYSVDVEIIKHDDVAYVVTASSTTTVSGLAVPNLTVSQVVDLYNHLADNKYCLVRLASTEARFAAVYGAEPTSYPTVSIVYGDTAIVRYQQITTTEVDITVKKFPQYNITGVTVGTDTIDITIA